jgi:hypothetical protein
MWKSYHMQQHFSPLRDHSLYAVQEIVSTRKTASGWLSRETLFLQGVSWKIQSPLPSISGIGLATADFVVGILERVSGVRRF